MRKLEVTAAEDPPSRADHTIVRFDYDLVAIGSGPAGQKAAIQTAKLGARVAIVDRGQMLGGVCVNTGTIPSKALREAVVALTGAGRRSPFLRSQPTDEVCMDRDVQGRRARRDEQAAQPQPARELSASSTASAGVAARDTPGRSSPGSRITTGRPSRSANAISAVVPQLPPTAITASPDAATARFRA